MKKRARRIADKLRMKAKAIRIGKRMDAPRYVINADHFAECSCWMCGNPRKYFGTLTLQEQRASASTDD
jgi:hypothetical protein